MPSFFGERTLRELHGNDFRAVLECREHFFDRKEEVPSLRLEMQRYAVVGRRATKGSGSQTECIILHSGQVSFMDGKDGPPDKKLLRCMELLRIRASLMNRRQARLLANHLNRFRRNRHHFDPGLSWSVVRGPAPSSSSRDWLNGVAGRGLTLQHAVGDLPTWGLDSNACEALTLYFIRQMPTAATEQVFAYGTPRYLLPPHFAIGGVLKARTYGVREGQWFDVERETEDISARSISKICEQARLLGCEDAFARTTAEDFWGEYQDGSPIDYSYVPTPSDVYASS